MPITIVVQNEFVTKKITKPVHVRNGQKNLSPVVQEPLENRDLCAGSGSWCIHTCTHAI